MALQAYKEIMEMLESQSFEIKAFSFGVNLDQLFQLGAYGGQTVAVPVKDSARDGRKVSVRARRRFVASELDGTTSQGTGASSTACRAAREARGPCWSTKPCTPAPTSPTWRSTLSKRLGGACTVQ